MLHLMSLLKSVNVWYKGEKMIAFFCRTPIHIFRTIQLKYEMFEKEKVDVYVFSSFNGASNIVQRLKKINIFENVYYIDDSTYMKGRHLVDLKACVIKSEFKKILSEKKYRELFTYNIYGPFNEVGYNVLKKNNIDLKYNVVEDAPTVYGMQYKENKCIKYLFKIFNLKSSIRNINCWWFSSPESMSPFRNGKKQKLPMVSRQNKKMCQTINYVFEYKEDVDLQNADVILMEECYSNDGLIKNEDIELFKQVIDIDKKFNSVVKLHPRSKTNRFENKFNVIKSQGIPWEVYILNCPMKDKILISLSCATMTSGKFMFGEESYSLLLFPIIEDKVIDTYDKSKYFTEERKKKLSSQKQMYDDKNKFFIAGTVKEAKNKLFEWLDNKNE